VAEASRRLSGGDLSARAEVEGDDELSEVAHAFNEMAARLAEVKAREREFLLAVGHDLRTPLTTISGYAEALADAAADPEETRRIGGVLEGETTRLRRLIEDVMLLARLDSAEFTLRPEPVDVAAHLSEVLEGFRPRAERARVRLAADLEADGLRLVDPDRLAQVVGNLVENALRYTPEAGEVRVTARVEGERLEVEVSDTGPGIDAEDLPRIFERFYVARKYRGVRPEGSGLGLSIVQRLVAAMGGEVSADSTPGEGTTVRVVLPAPAATPAAADRRDSAVP
jgi:two-component system sensor histidine kinase BaeS